MGKGGLAWAILLYYVAGLFVVSLTCIELSIGVCVCVYVLCMRVCMYACVCVCVCMYVCMYVCVFFNIFIGMLHYISD